MRPPNMTIYAVTACLALLAPQAAHAYDDHGHRIIEGPAAVCVPIP